MNTKHIEEAAKQMETMGICEDDVMPATEDVEEKSDTDGSSGGGDDACVSGSCICRKMKPCGEADGKLRGTRRRGERRRCRGGRCGKRRLWRQLMHQGGPVHPAMAMMAPYQLRGQHHMNMMGHIHPRFQPGMPKPKPEDSGCRPTNGPDISLAVPSFVRFMNMMASKRSSGPRRMHRGGAETMPPAWFHHLNSVSGSHVGPHIPPGPHFWMRFGSDNGVPSGEQCEESNKESIPTLEGNHTHKPDMKNDSMQDGKEEDNCSNGTVTDKEYRSHQGMFMPPWAMDAAMHCHMYRRQMARQRQKTARQSKRCQRGSTETRNEKQ